MLPQCNAGDRYTLEVRPIGGTEMTALQLEEYLTLLSLKYELLGEHYVNRQAAWAEDQLHQRGVV